MVSERGGTMLEVLLTLALAAVMLPFIVNYQHDRIERAENVALTNKMTNIQAALERYMDAHKKELIAPVGKNIARVNLRDLDEYGAYATSDGDSDRFQIRVLKSADRAGHSTLQGIIILNDRDISPMRTREIVNLGGGNMGFVDRGVAYGAFGTWRANTALDFGISGADGIARTTQTRMDQEQYLWRIPSENNSDATMLSSLNLAGHNVTGMKFADAGTAHFEETIKSDTTVAEKIIFQNRTTVDGIFNASEAVISGTMSADSKNLDVAGTFNLTDMAKLTNFTADNLWTMNLNLSGLSISATSGQPALLKINQATDMVGGNISATVATIGFTGSVTPKLIVQKRIEDSSDASYYWDVAANTARLYDAALLELNRMAPGALRRESNAATASTQSFTAPAMNKNATAADFMNSILDIQKRVRAKYRALNLE